MFFMFLRPLGAFTVLPTMEHEGELPHGASHLGVHGPAYERRNQRPERAGYPTFLFQVNSNEKGASRGPVAPIVLDGWECRRPLAASEGARACIRKPLFPDDQIRREKVFLAA